MTRHGHTPRPISQDSTSPGPSYRLEIAADIQFPDQNGEATICDKVKTFFRQLPKRQTEALVLGHIFYWTITKFVNFFLLVHMTKEVQFNHFTIGGLILFAKICEAFFSITLRCIQPYVKFKFYGRRKLQHGIGAVCCMVALPLIFNSCSWFNNAFNGVIGRDIFYAFMLMFYFLGVRTVGFMLELFQKFHWKSKMNSPRQRVKTWSMLEEFFTDVILFAIIWLALAIDSNRRIKSNELNSVSLVVVVFGIVFNLLFHCIFNEKDANIEEKLKENHVTERNEEGKREEDEIKSILSNESIPYHLAKILLTTSNEISFRTTLRDREFWKRSSLYVGTRCLNLVIYSYMVLYMIDNLQTSKVWIGRMLFWYTTIYWLFKSMIHFAIEILGKHICWFIGHATIVGFSLLCAVLQHNTHFTMFVALFFLLIGINFLMEISLDWLKEYYGEGKVIEMKLRDKEKKKHITLSLCDFMENLSVGVLVFIIEAFIHTQYKQNSVACGNDDVISSYRYILSIFPILLSTIFLIIVYKYIKLDNKASKRTSPKSTPERHPTHDMSEEISQRLDLEEQIQKSNYPDLDYIGMKLALPRYPSPIHHH